MIRIGREIQCLPYAGFFVRQLKGLTEFHILVLDFTWIPSVTYGQTTQLPHFFIPGMVLCALVNLAGILGFMILSLIFLCLLYATIGGSGKTSRRYGSCPVIDLQCLLVRFVTEGSLGSHKTTKTGLVLSVFLLTSLKATSLGTLIALLIAVFIKLFG